MSRSISRSFLLPLSSSSTNAQQATFRNFEAVQFAGVNFEKQRLHARSRLSSSIVYDTTEAVNLLSHCEPHKMLNSVCWPFPHHENQFSLFVHSVSLQCVVQITFSIFNFSSYSKKKKFICMHIYLIRVSATLNAVEGRALGKWGQGPPDSHFRVEWFGSK